jgi:exosortase/archaeosortase family protein
MSPIDIKLPSKLQPYKGIIFFMVTLLVANLIWKISITGEEANQCSQQVLLWGIDVSLPFDFMADLVAKSTLYILNLLGMDVVMNNENVLRHTTGYGVRIIWACSGLKQIYIFFCIALFSRGHWNKKLFFIPIGIIMVHFTNVIRIVITAAITKYHHEWFPFLHDYVTKYAFYLIIFLMWVVWDEVIISKQSSSSKQ